MNSKGMSQILVLIVAAVVLMTVGLLLITGFGNVFGDLIPGLEGQSCQAQLESACQQRGDTATISELPSTCIQNGQPVDNVDGIQSGSYQCGS